MIGKKEIDELVAHLQDGTWVIEDWSTDTRFVSPIHVSHHLRIVDLTVGPTGPALHPNNPWPLKPLKRAEETDMEEKRAIGNPYGSTNWLPGTQILDRGSGEEPIIGFRDFLVVDTICNGVHLMSRNQDLWQHRKRNVATCGPNNPLGNEGRLKTPHDAPHHDCDCGIYAYDTPDHHNLKTTEGIVWAELALWGDVYLCETGYRAEFAYPMSLFLKDNGLKKERRVVAELERNYGVPVYLVEEREGKTAADIMAERIVKELLTPPSLLLGTEEGELDLDVAADEHND